MQTPMIKFNNKEWNELLQMKPKGVVDTLLIIIPN